VSDDKILVCMTITAQPDPVEGSEERWCHICAATIWVSPEGLDFLSTDYGVRPTCMECALGLSETQEDITTLPVPGSERFGDVRPALSMFKRALKERKHGN